MPILRVYRHLNTMQQETLERKDAAMKFGAYLQKLALNGQIDALSITIHALSSDNLFQLAQAVGIKELSVTAQFGS